MASTHSLDLVGLEHRLERQEATIARLLESLPPRADAIYGDRLHQILRELVDHATTLFPGRTVTGTAVPETDRDTPARHRLTLRIAGGLEIDPADFAERTFELYRYAADALSPEEFEAVLLIVEPHYPDTSADCGS